LPLTQSLSTTQFAGQVAMAPLHNSGEQVGTPGDPWGIGVQVPSLPGRLHESQSLEQAVLQQALSTQRLTWHSLLPSQYSPRIFFDSQLPELHQ
jgi:hypothetical protein